MNDRSKPTDDSGKIVSSGASNSLWKPFLRRTENVPIDLITNSKGHKYQVLEIIVAKLAALLEHGYDWSVSPIGADRGIDFSGKRKIFEIPQLDLAPTSLILGQCKYRSSTMNLVDEFAAALAKMCDDNERLPSLILLFAVGRLTQFKDVETETLTKRYQTPILVLSEQEIEALLFHFFEELRPLFEDYLTADEFEALCVRHNEWQATASPRVELSVSKPSKVDSGRLFQIEIETKHYHPELQDSKLRWVPPEGEGEYNSQSLRLVKPIDLASKAGVSNGNRSSQRLRQTLIFLSYASGDRDLGKIIAENPNGDVLFSTDLGTVEVQEQFHPPFFRTGVHQAFSDLEAISKRSGPGLTGAVAVRGVGGSGKSRLCQEIGYDVIARGGDWISISHTQAPDTTLRMFQELLLALSPKGKIEDSESNFDLVTTYLRTLTPSLESEARSLLEVVFERRNQEALDADEQSLLVKVLTVMILMRVNSEKLGVHLSDLHWANAQELTLLTQLIQSLKSVTPTITPAAPSDEGVFFVFEGRKGESGLKDALLGTPDYSTEAWERFSTLLSESPIDVEELDDASSRSMLHHWFENQESPHRRIRSDLVMPQQNTLFSAILRNGSGNPFYMIEYVTLLAQQGLVRRNERTGRYYLARPLEENLSPPRTVSELIARRFRYVEANAPLVSELIRGIALIQDRVPRSLFERLKERITGSADETILNQSQFLFVPQDRSSDVRFRHEAFFAAIHNSPMSIEPRDRIVDLYLEWLDEHLEETALSDWRRGRVLEQSSNPIRAQIINAYRGALDKAQGAKDHELAEKALQGLVGQQPTDLTEWVARPSEQIGDDADILYRLAKLQTNVARWGRAEANLLLLDKKLTAWQQRPELLSGVLVELANVRLHQFKYKDAIALSTQAMEAVERNSQPARALLGDSPDALAVRAINRRGVTQWFKGSYVSAAKDLQGAFDLACDLELQDQRLFVGIDAAAILMHSSPQGAIKRYEELERLNLDVKSKKDELLIGCQKSIAELVSLRLDSSSASQMTDKNLRRIVSDVERIFQIATKTGFTHEQLWASLLLGVLYVNLNLERAIHWSANALNLAFSCNNLEWLWMAHLNLAQACALASDTPAQESAALHAKEALRLMNASFLDESPSEASRLNVIARPLQGALKVLRDLDLEEDDTIRWAQDAFDLVPDPVGTWSVEEAIGLDFGDRFFILMP